MSLFFFSCLVPGTKDYLIQLNHVVGKRNGNKLPANDLRTDVSELLGLGLLRPWERSLFWPCNNPDLGTSLSYSGRTSLYIAEQGGLYRQYSGAIRGGTDGRAISAHTRKHLCTHTSANNFHVSVRISSL